jgi:NAD(P)-dependent dehydrogenase (short-subunit alcohol dehydrogenase family)
MMLRDKVVIVTGAASGIGLASAKFFLEQGAVLAVSDRDLAGLRARWQGETAVEAIACDVASEQDCENLVTETVRRFGAVDGLFHCAGISDPVKPALELAADEWQHVIDVNLRGTFLMCKAVGQVMTERRRGAIVTTSSVNGLSGIPRRHAYGPAKAAVAQLTRTLACEWGASNVRVNAVAPTYVATPMISRLAAEGKVDIARLERRTPLGRIATAEDVAKAAAFLMSDWSEYVTGVVLPVDGGWTAYGGPGDVVTA